MRSKVVGVGILLIFLLSACQSNTKDLKDQTITLKNEVEQKKYIAEIEAQKKEITSANEDLKWQLEKEEQDIIKMDRTVLREVSRLVSTLMLASHDEDVVLMNSLIDDGWKFYKKGDVYLQNVAFPEETYTFKDNERQLKVEGYSINGYGQMSANEYVVFIQLNIKDANGDYLSPVTFMNLTIVNDNGRWYIKSFEFDV